MIKINGIDAPVGFTHEDLVREAAARLGISTDEIKTLEIRKKSLDARRKGNIHYTLTVAVATDRDEALLARGGGGIAPDSGYTPLQVRERAFTHPPVVVGSGPAGLFAALTLARAGARPILLERGGSVDERRAAVERFWRGGELDPEMNVQFGEGGAGTFSDGKLTTGTKDPRTQEVLHEFHRCGAPEDILYDAKPHIGTDLLGGVVKAIREQIIALGGRVEFHARLTGYLTGAGGAVTHAVYDQGGEAVTAPTDHLVLATGHSARDVFTLLAERGAPLEQKAFSVGVRIEHRQADIDRAMYGGGADRPPLPPADYRLAVHLESGRGVYTFCMCPGGQVVAGASEPGHTVTNGMSRHARDGENANSALLVGVGPGDFGSDDPLAGVAFQRAIESAAYGLTGGFTAPAATVGDFLAGRTPTGFGAVRPTYRPAVTPALPDAYLPEFVCAALREALPLMGRKIHGFDDPQALLTGPETRSSSPVRILRGADGCAVGTPGLYPCGEGAGYAGGIMSAAVDGIKTAQAILTAGD